MIVTPPKTGSTSLHKWLGAQGWVTIMGPQFDDGVIEKHTCARPWQYHMREQKKCILIVRNPYDRMCSLHKHWQKFWKRTDGMYTFLRTVIGSEQFYSKDLKSYWDAASATIFVKLEEIHLIKNHIDASGLPTVENVGEGVSSHTDFTRNFTRVLYARDFSFFGYEE